MRDGGVAVGVAILGLALALGVGDGLAAGAEVPVVLAVGGVVLAALQRVVLAPVLFAIVLPKPKGSVRTISIAAPPPIP